MIVMDFNEGWFFTKDSNTVCAKKVKEKGEWVNLPHCFNASDGQSGEGMFKGSCRYEKWVILSESELGQYHFLEIGAASLMSKVYVNGQKAGESRCGFSMFRLFLNPYLREGENHIVIFADNSPTNDVYPLMADFSFYGGLYREVKWLQTEEQHFDLTDKSRDGIYVNQKYISEKSFVIEVKGRVINERQENIHGKIELILLNQDKEMVWHREIDGKISGVKEFEATGLLENLELWQGLEKPYLYTLRVNLYRGKKLVDERRLEIGFRHIEITPDRGVFLNGKHLKLNGVSRHQDFAEIGNALTKEHMELDMELIKEIGANTVRLSHYQHDDYFYTLCDRTGLLVWAEIPFISIPTTSDSENKNAKEQLKYLIKQVGNHTSVYCWGVQNEITIAVENEKIHDMVSELVAFAKKLDPNRAVAQANIYSVANESILNELTDLVGYNLYYGWYYGELQNLGERLDEFHRVRQNIPMMVTEYGVDTNPLLHSYEPEVKDYTEEYQLLFQDNALKSFKERDFVLGGYVWAMFDFGSEIRNEGGTKGKNQKGLVTIDRKTKKDAFYLCKAYWSTEPFVKLAGSRFVNRHRQENEITVISNIAHIKLYVNQKLVHEQRKTEPMNRIEGVKLEQGKNTISVEAFDLNGNCCTDTMVLTYREEADNSYVLEKPANKAHVTNWFQQFDLSNVAEVTLKEGYYSTFDTIAELYKDKMAKKIVIKYFGDVAKDIQIKAMVGLMTIDSMSKLSRFNRPKEFLSLINSELNDIPKK